MSKDIQVSTSQKGDVAVITIKGDVTAITGEAIGNAYHKDDNVLHSPKLLLQFDKDCYINSGGLATIIDIASEGRRKEQRIHAFGLSEHFQKIFHMVGLTRCITLYESEQEALSHFN